MTQRKLGAFLRLRYHLAENGVLDSELVYRLETLRRLVEQQRRRRLREGFRRLLEVSLSRKIGFQKQRLAISRFALANGLILGLKLENCVLLLRARERQRTLRRCFARRALLGAFLRWQNTIMRDFLALMSRQVQAGRTSHAVQLLARVAKRLEFKTELFRRRAFYALAAPLAPSRTGEAHGSQPSRATTAAAVRRLLNRRVFRERLTTGNPTFQLREYFRRFLAAG